MVEWRFKRDTAFRKTFFVPESFSHPAKMDAQLLIKIVGDYTKPGEVILDPMAGSGTTMLACTMGRNVILVELEEKFCKMCRDNWEQVRMRPQLGSSMGECQIIQGDARNLEGLLADKVLMSPPYADIERRDRSKEDWWNEEREVKFSGGSAKIAKGYQADKIITSPPYAIDDKNICHTKEGKTLSDYDKARGYKPTAHQTTDYSTNPSNIGNLSYGDIDAVITSPPYEGSVSASTGGERDQSSARQRERRLRGKGYDPAKYQGGVGRNLEVDFQYSKATENIGNLTSQSYLEAMLQVYQQCFAVLKDGGPMILVTKNFIRNKKVVRLDADTIKLCEQAGFSYLHRHWRKLPAQSFWRIIYSKKHPEVEQIEYEDIVVFKK